MALCEISNPGNSAAVLVRGERRFHDEVAEDGNGSKDGYRDYMGMGSVNNVST
jgi:hypothetical protein